MLNRLWYLYFYFYFLGSGNSYFNYHWRITYFVILYISCFLVVFPVVLYLGLLVNSSFSVFSSENMAILSPLKPLEIIMLFKNIYVHQYSKIINIYMYA
jgi:hypothetical protein